jgi:hypothetical protein
LAIVRGIDRFCRIVLARDHAVRTAGIFAANTRFVATLTWRTTNSVAALTVNGIAAVAAEGITGVTLKHTVAAGADWRRMRRRSAAVLAFTAVVHVDLI